MTKWVKSKCNKYVRIVIMEILAQEIKLCNYMYSPQNWLIYISLTWGNKVILFCFNFRFMPITNLLKETYLGLELELVHYHYVIIKNKNIFFLFTHFLKLISVLYIIFRSIIYKQGTGIYTFFCSQGAQLCAVCLVTDILLSVWVDIYSLKFITPSTIVECSLVIFYRRSPWQSLYREGRTPSLIK